MKTAEVAEELLDKAAIARAKGVSRQAIDDLRKRNKLPPPDYEVGDKPLWKLETLYRFGVLHACAVCGQVATRRIRWDDPLPGTPQVEGTPVCEEHTETRDLRFPSDPMEPD